MIIERMFEKIHKTRESIPKIEVKSTRKSCKKILLGCMATVALMAGRSITGSLTTWAESFTYTDENNIQWTCEDLGVNKVSIKPYDGNSISGSVTIPSTVTYEGTTYSVTTIGYYAFYNCSSLTSVTIPESVTTIGYYAFYNCSSLTSVTIPDNVTTIGEGAFSNCSNLTSVTIPDSVTTIGQDAFSNCRSLTSVTIPDSVTTIGDYAFESCDGITSVTIPESVTTIGNNAFAYCSSLTSVTIPESVTTIGNGAFAYCSSLTSVTIPESVTTIGNGAFQDCSSLEYINVAEGNQNYKADKYGVLFTKGAENGETLIQYPIGNTRTSYTIPDDVKEIGDFAFKSCSNLTAVTIPDSVTTIDNSAFNGCRSLTTVTIPDSVTTIGAGAFNGCRSLTTVTIPDSVTTIGAGAFADCSSLADVYVKDGTTIGNSAFKNRVYARIWKYGVLNDQTGAPAGKTLVKINSVAMTDGSTVSSGSIACNVMNNGYVIDSLDDSVTASGITLTHTLTEEQAAAATCTENGHITGYTCEGCGKHFSDEQGTTEIEANSWVIEALGHNLTAHTAVAASCTTAGSSVYWSCDRCNKYFSDAAGTQEIEENSWVIPIDENAHAWGEVSYTWEKDGDDWQCTATRVCGNESSHVETKAGTVSSEVTTEATCTTKGVITYTATFEEGTFDTETQTKTEEIPIDENAHAWGEVSYEWSINQETGAMQCTATRVCANDSNHVEELGTATVTGYSGTYDGAAHGLSVSNNIEGATLEYSIDAGVTWDITAPTYTNVGETTVYVRVQGNESYASPMITIEAKALTITPDDNQGKTYGGNEPTLTYTVSGLVEGDTLNGTLSRESGENVGQYEITQGTITNENNSNYAISFVSGKTFTITAKELMITPNDNQEKTYGEEDPTLTYTVSGLVEGDTLNGTLGRETGENAGKYEITQGTITNGNNSNYAVSFVSGKMFTIKKAQATAPTVEEYSGTYDGQEHGVAVGETTEGTIVYSTDEGDNKSWSTTAPTETKVGTTTVHVKVQGDGNHTDSEVVNGTITITAKELISDNVSLSASEFTYNGSEQKPTVTVKVKLKETDETETTLSPYNAETEKGDYTVSYKDSEGTTVESPTNVGTYTVIIEGMGNYTGTVNDKTFTIDLQVGDVEGDGDVDVQDLNKLYEHIAGISELDDEQKQRADIVGDDGKINILDLQALYNILSKG